jgi:hypothetical protein
MPLNREFISAHERGRWKELLVKIIRTLAACALAGSAMVGGGLSVAAVATSSVAPAAAVAGAFPQVCPNGTIYEYGSCPTL